jgi:GNAT superfamily N-acetyltransferase
MAGTDSISAPEKLTPEHDVSTFTSGEPALDDWLRRRALANEDSGASRTYVVRSGGRVVGYYALANGAVARAEVPGRVRRNMPDPVPVMVLGRLAVDRAYQGRRLGVALLRDAVLRTLQAAGIAGIRAILVHAISEDAGKFYERCGFTASPVDPRTLMITMLRRSAALPIALALLLPACASRSFRLEVDAGAHERRGTLVSGRIPAAGAGPWRLVRADTGTEIPVQVTPAHRGGETESTVEWTLEEPLPAGAKRSYRLETTPARAGSAEPRALCRDADRRRLEISLLGKPAFRYNYVEVPPPAGVDPIFTRGGYLHPVWTPSGRTVTHDYPANHLHHHGIWWAWTKTEFEGRATDFWNSKAGEGRVEFAGLDGMWDGPVHAGFRARHRFVDLKAPGGPKAALDETWTVKAVVHGDGFLFDLESSQTCAGPSPLHLKKYHYGGLGVRGAASWEGKEGVSFLTSEGRTRADGHGTTGRWCALEGTVDGAPATLAILCHPGNFRAPQGMRIHPAEPFFCYAPEQAGDFAIEPGKPYVSRYRFLVRDGPAEAARIERLWRDYAEPPAVTEVK